MAEHAEFTNDVVARQNLPHLTDAHFEQLDPSFLRLRDLTSAIAAAVVVTVATALVVLRPSWLAFAVAAAAVALAVAGALIRSLAARRMGYLVREHDVSFRSGLLTRSAATVPFARVQHVAIQSGPIDRAFGLAALQLRTAGGFVAIPGLRAELAGRLKQLVADRAGALAAAEANETAPPTDDTP